MADASTFKTPEGEVAYLAAYAAAMELWPVPYEELEIPTRFGITHAVSSGPKSAPPLVLLHGYFATLAMWSPNIADLSEHHRVYAVDVMGHPSKSIPDPDKPIRDAADFMGWLSETLDGLGLDRFSLAGMSYGGWLALNFAMIAPERVQRLALLSPAACFQPIARQFGLRAILMGLLPIRLTSDSIMRWMGFKRKRGDIVNQRLIDLFSLGFKHFRLSTETISVMASVFSDEELQGLRVPVLLLIGENEVIYDASKALQRARRLVPDFQGELVPRCSHDMSSTRHDVVDARMLDFLSAD